MERLIATVNSHGQIVLPIKALNIQPGSLWEITIDGSTIILNLLEESKHEHVLSPNVIALRGMFADGPSLEDDLLEWRRSDKS